MPDSNLSSVSDQKASRLIGGRTLGLILLGVGTVVFAMSFSVIQKLIFMDVTSPFLWKWMLIYGALIVAVGQLTWQFGLRFGRSCDICIAESALPVLGLGFAFLFLGQFPSSSEWIGGLVILLGITMALRGKMTGGKADEPATLNSEESCRSSRGFTGV